MGSELSAAFLQGRRGTRSYFVKLFLSGFFTFCARLIPALLVVMKTISPAEFVSLDDGVLCEGLCQTHAPFLRNDYHEVLC